MYENINEINEINEFDELSLQDQNEVLDEFQEDFSENENIQNEFSNPLGRSENGWLHQADKEYAKNGDSRYYDFCLENAAEEHRKNNT